MRLGRPVAVLDPRYVLHLTRQSARLPTLTDYQTRVLEGGIAILRNNLPALRDSLDNLAATIRQTPAQSETVNGLWLELETVIHHLELLERVRSSFAEHVEDRSSRETPRAPQVVDAIRSVELHELLRILHAID